MLKPGLLSFSLFTLSGSYDCLSEIWRQMSEAVCIRCRRSYASAAHRSPQMKDASIAVPHQMALATEIPSLSIAKNVQPVLATKKTPDSMPHGVNTCAQEDILLCVAVLGDLHASGAADTSTVKDVQAHLTECQERKCRDDKPHRYPEVEVQRADLGALHWLYL